MERATPPLQLLTVSDLQAERNRQTRGLRLSFASHREQMMALIHSAGQAYSGPGQPSITVLGAGNCLDLDLQALAGQFGIIQLVDIDRSAVETAVAAQPGIGGSLRIIAPVDLAAPLSSLSPSDIATASDCELVRKRLEEPLDCALAEPADVVISACVLSQIMESLAILVPAEHPVYMPFLAALRQGHLRRMLQLLKPGGCGVLVSDLVSSESAPALSGIHETELEGFLAECLRTANFFSGLNPALVLHDLRSQTSLAASIRDVRIHPPWRWELGTRTYAVYAVIFSHAMH